MRKAVLYIAISLTLAGAETARADFGRVESKATIETGGDLTGCWLRVIAQDHRGGTTETVVGYSSILAENCRDWTFLDCPAVSGQTALSPGVVETTWTCEEPHIGHCISYSGMETQPGHVAGSSLAFSTACQQPESEFTLRGRVISSFSNGPFAAPCDPGYFEDAVKVQTRNEGGTVYFVKEPGLPNVGVPNCIEAEGYLTHRCASAERAEIHATSLRILPASECDCSGNPLFCE